ncbi:MAG TPA: sigma-70 family RNA polymerase sigma factor [Lacipirellulaceae bacterium]|nr:sigma-70 family RNA polymerase sigma factor [Lacipirellulaceae bacterium]
MADEAPKSDALLVRAAAGDGAAWGSLLAGQQERLTRMVAFRMDARLRGRIDAVDIVQDAFAEASEHRAEYFRAPTVPPFLWLRGVVINKMLEIHRHHLGTRMRDVKRELPLDAAWSWDDTSAALCEQLTGHLTSPSVAAIRVEVKTRLAEALDKMNAIDREVLALRHFEQLTSAEAAQVLGIQEPAASKRYLRALERLKQILSEMPGGLTEVRP